MISAEFLELFVAKTNLPVFVGDEDFGYVAPLDRFQEAQDIHSWVIQSSADVLQPYGHRFARRDAKRLERLLLVLQVTFRSSDSHAAMGDHHCSQ